MRPVTKEISVFAWTGNNDPIDFEGTEIERRVTNAGTNALIIREFMEECIKDPSGTLPGKTIFFAITKAHAYRLQELFDRMYPEHKGKLARVLVSEDSRVHGKGGLLDQFKNKNMPRVAISVDMLDTGVDVREAVNLVFAKPVYSYVKFWQMIGRGTRVLDENPAKRKPWCPEKDKFLIIDSWGNFQYFQMTPQGREPGKQEPLPVRLFKARLDKLETAIATSRTDIIESVKKDLQSDIAALPQNNVVIFDNKPDLAIVEDEQFWSQFKAENMGFLRSIIAPILRARSDADFKAMRFETQVVELGTAVLSDNQEVFEAIRESLLSQVKELPLTVNIVAKEENLIEDVLSSSWWATPTEEKLRSLVTRMAPLMKFREPTRDPMMKLDIEDLTAIKEWIEFGPQHERMTSSVYREKIESYILDLVNQNPTLMKIKMGIPIVDDEVDELADILASQDPYITEDLLRRIYDNKTAHFIQFIKHILGLEKLESWTQTVARAFDDFITHHNTFTALQIQFIQTLRTFILQTGGIDKQALIDAPFTRLHPQGIRGIFQPGEIEEILQFAGKLTE